MSAFITAGARAVEKICIVVYQSRIFDAVAYKSRTRGLHSHGAMGTDAASNLLDAAEQTTSFIQRRFIMKRVTKIAIGAVAALTLGLTAAVVSAHPYGYGPGWGMGQSPGYGPGAGMGPGMGPMGMGRGAMGPGAGGYGPMGQGMGPQAWSNPATAAERRLAGLKSELKITAAQESAWKAFADQAKQQAEAMQALMASAQGSAQTTAPERIELRNKIMKKRQEQMEKGAVVFKDLYAVLSPEQKALADQHFGFGMMGGRGMAFNRSVK